MGSLIFNIHISQENTISIQSVNFLGKLFYQIKGKFENDSENAQVISYDGEF